MAALLLVLGTHSVAAQAPPLTGNQVDAGTFPAPDPAPKPSSLYFGAVLTTNSPGWEIVVPRSDAAGALVLSVAPGSPVEKAGLRLGDVIVAVDGKEVRGEEQVTVAQQASADDRRLFTILAPNGRPRTIEVRPASSQSRINADYLERQLAENPDIATRALAAQVAADPALGLDLSLGLVRDVPSFGAAHGLVALHSLRLARAQPGAASGSLPQETVAAINDAMARAMELDPQSAAIRVQAASIFLDLGDQERAESEALRAVAIDDSSPVAYYLLGSTRLARNDAQAALPELHRAASLNPYQPTYFESLVNAYTDLGREDQAAKTRESLNTTLTSGSTEVYGHRRAPVFGALAALVAVVLLLELAWRRYGRPAASAQHHAQANPTPGSLAKQLVIVELLVVMGAWSMASPVTAPFLGVTARGPMVTELFGRILPGLAVVILSAVAASRLRRAAADPAPLGNAIPAGLFLCGLWMTGTQVTLVIEAVQIRYPDVAIFRLFPGATVLALSVWLNALVLGAQERTPGDSSQPRTIPAGG